MNTFKQPTQNTTCKTCGANFESKLVFGQWVTKCNDCKTPFKNAGVVGYNIKHPQKETFKYCNHNDSNPGGYCNVCGVGRDFS